MAVWCYCSGGALHGHCAHYCACGAARGAVGTPSVHTGGVIPPGVVTAFWFLPYGSGCVATFVPLLVDLRTQGECSHFVSFPHGRLLESSSYEAILTPPLPEKSWIGSLHAPKPYSKNVYMQTLFLDFCWPHTWMFGP